MCLLWFGGDRSTLSSDTCHHLLIPWGLGAAVFSLPSTPIPLLCTPGEMMRPRSSRTWDTQALMFEELHLHLLLTLPGGRKGPWIWVRWPCGGERLHRSEFEFPATIIEHLLYVGPLLSTMHVPSCPILTVRLSELSTAAHLLTHSRLLSSFYVPGMIPGAE